MTQQDNAWRRIAAGIGRPLLAIALALLIGLVIISIAGEDPIESYRALIGGAFVGRSNIENTLVRSIPVIASGLAVAVAFACGMFNMGVEGQLYLGAFAAAWIGFSIKGVPPLLHVLLAIGLSAVVGAAWAYLPAIARIKWGTSEIVTTMMLNYVAQYFTSYLVSFPFKEPGDLQQTPAIFSSAELYELSAASRLHVGLLLVVVFAVIIAFLLKRTALGYEIRMTGLSPSVSRASGINTDRTAIRAMLISGAIGGIAGAIEILGVHHRFINNFSPGYGWDGLAVSLLAKGNPIGILLSGIFYGGLQSGANIMEFATDVPKQLIDSLRAIIILFVAADFTGFKFLKAKPKLPKGGGQSGCKEVKTCGRNV